MKISPPPHNPASSIAQNSFNVADILEQRAIVMRKRRKRIRTRAALVAAAARELERVGYEALTAEVISEAAGMARGTFYLHYKNRSEIISVVMRFYWFLLSRNRPRGGATLTLAQTIHRMNFYTVNVVSRNSRLLLGRETLMRENLPLARRLDALNRAWANLVIKILTSRGIVKEGDTDIKFHTLRARAIIGMSDILLRDIYRGTELETDPEEIDLDLVIRVLDDLWLRSLGP